MANTKQAKKRAGQNDKRRARNRAVRSETRTMVKSLRNASVSEPEKAKGLLSETISGLDVAVRKGVLHKKTASRLKSRVALLINKVTAAAPPATS